MSHEIRIAGREIGDNHPVFVIAEVGINHNGDLSRARQLIDEAANAGASAVKLQTYSTEKRVPADSPVFDILKQCEISFEDQKELFEYGAQKGLVMFSTPFDSDSVDFLASIEVPCFKIASFDIVNTELLRAVSAKKCPVIVSRGMANTEEIDIAVKILRQDDTPFALLHCVSAYPVPSESDVNLSTIGMLKQRYQCPVGYSDHTIGMDIPAYAVAAGACIIEKHFTLSKDDEGPDHAMSAEPEEFATMIKMIERAHSMKGKPVEGPIEAEKDILQYRRST